VKRFIELSGQIYDDSDKNFAFFCTAVDKFEEFAGFQEWESISDFAKDYFSEKTSYKKLDRYLSLIPEKYWRSMSGMTRAENLIYKQQYSGREDSCKYLLRIGVRK